MRRKTNSREVPNRVIAVLGDVNPEYGSTVLFRNRYGLQIQHWEAEDDADEGEVYTVWTTDVPDDVFARHNWTSASRVARTTDQDPEDLLRMGRSRSPAARAQAIMDIASHEGWGSFDLYPQTGVTLATLMRRWGNTFTRRGVPTGRKPKRGERGRFVKPNGTARTTGSSRSQVVSYVARAIGDGFVLTNDEMTAGPYQTATGSRVLYAIFVDRPANRHWLSNGRHVFDDPMGVAVQVVERYGRGEARKLVERAYRSRDVKVPPLPHVDAPSRRRARAAARR